MTPHDDNSGSPTPAPDKLYRTLDSLEDLADFARQRFGHALSLPMEDFHALTARLREELPREILQAEEIADRTEQRAEEARRAADAILNDAQKEVDRILEDARKQAAALVTESPEVRFASAQHRDIIAQAQEAAMNIRQDVDVYVRETWDRLEDYVRKVQNQVRSGLVALNRERENDTRRAPR